uniref:ANK_REP_REGION domain-containing protein n=1 Tax=Mesocestoides corti TaxID=53468 RepID=A0A5K3F9L6_MESCO
MTPIHLSTKKQDIAMLRFLIQEGAEVDCTDENGRTALMIACESGNAEIAELLISCGANIDLCDNNGQTAEEIAKSSEQTQCYQLLHSLRDSVGRVTNSGESKKAGRKLVAGEVNKQYFRGGGGGGGEDTGDEILEGVFESSETDTSSSDDAFVKHWPPLQGHGGVGRTSSIEESEVLPRHSPRELKSSKQSGASFSNFGKTSVLPTGHTASVDTALKQPLRGDSWSSDTSDVNDEFKQKKVNLAAALLAKRAKEVHKTETEVIVSPSPIHLTDNTESWESSSGDGENNAKSAVSVVDNQVTSPPRKQHQPSENVKQNVGEDDDSPWDSSEQENEFRGKNELAVNRFPPGLKAVVSSAMGQEEAALNTTSSVWDSDADDGISLTKTPDDVVRQQEDDADDPPSTLTQVSEDSEKRLSNSARKNASRGEEKSQVENSRKNIEERKSLIPEPLYVNTEWLKSVNSDRSAGSKTPLSGANRAPSSTEIPQTIPLLSDRIQTPSRRQTPEGDGTGSLVVFSPLPANRNRLATRSVTSAENINQTPSRMTPQRRQVMTASVANASQYSGPPTVNSSGVLSESTKASEARSLHHDLLQSIEALDREEETQRELGRVLLDKSGSRRHDPPAKSPLHGDLTDVFIEITHLREKLEEEMARSGRLEANHNSTKQQLIEKEAELTRLQSSFRELEVDLRRVNGELEVSRSTIDQIRAQHKDELDGWKQKLASKNRPVTSTVTSPEMWATIDASTETEADPSSETRLADRLVMRTQVELSRLRNHLLDSKFELRGMTDLFAGDLQRLALMLKELSRQQANQKFSDLVKENQKLAEIKTTLELKINENSREYEEQLQILQNRLLSVQTIKDEKAQLLKANQNLRFELDTQTSTAKSTEASLKRAEMELKMRQEAMRQLESELDTARRERSESERLLVEAKEREKSSSQWISLLFKNLKSVEEASRGVGEHLAAEISKCHSNSQMPSAVDFVKMSELLRVLESVQDAAKHCLNEAKSACYLEASCEPAGDEQAPPPCTRAFLPCENTPTTEKYLIERIAVLTEELHKATELVNQQKAQIDRLNTLGTCAIKQDAVTTTGYSSDVDDACVQTPQKVLTARKTSPIGSFENVLKGRHFASSLSVSSPLPMDLEQPIRKLAWVNKNDNAETVNGNFASPDTSYTKEVTFAELQSENEHLRRQLVKTRSANKKHCCNGGRGQDIRDVEPLQSNNRQPACYCHAKFQDTEGDTVEKLQRRVMELECEKNHILVEKRLLEENSRAEHRLAGKLLSQLNLRLRRGSLSSRKRDRSVVLV